MRQTILFLFLICNCIKLEGYSVAELIELSLLNSPETAAVAQQVIRSEGSLGAIFSDKYPKLSLNGTVSHGRDYSFINGPLTNFTFLRGDIVLDYLLFNFGKLDHSIHSARALVAASLYSRDFSVQQVIIKTLRAYFLASRAVVNLDVEKGTLKQTEELLKGTEELVNAGLKGKTDLLALQVRRNDSLMRLKEREADYLSAIAHMNVLIGKPTNTPLELAPLEDVPAARPLLETSRYLRSDLQAKYQSAEAKREQWKATKSAALPSIRLTARSGAEKYVKSKSKGYDYDIAVRLN
jgi:outer membrane protein TolC